MISIHVSDQSPIFVLPDTLTSSKQARQNQQERINRCDANEMGVDANAAFYTANANESVKSDDHSPSAVASEALVDVTLSP